MNVTEEDVAAAIAAIAARTQKPEPDLNNLSPRPIR
jgi:hypothetical protein